MNYRTAPGRHDRFDRAVRCLFPMIENRLSASDHLVWSEHMLRRELIACILGSQVRLEMATAALDRLESAGLLRNEWWCGDDDYESTVFEVLSGRAGGAPGEWSYRFPQARARQIGARAESAANG